MKKRAFALSALTLQLLATTGVALSDDEKDAEHIVVIAARAPRPIQDVAGMVSDIDDAFINENLVNSLSDLFRYEPGINVDNSGTRFGSSSIAIRGIGENRVAILVDGIPVADQFDIGNYSNSGRDLLDLDAIHRIEVLHGPASSLYGSDAVGGVVSFTTLDPNDLLQRSNGHDYVALRSAYDGKDASQIVTLTGAFAQQNLSALLTYATREGAQTDHSAKSDREDEKQYTQQSGLAKVVWESAQGHRLEMTAESMDKAAQTALHSLIGYGRFATTTALNGDDNSRRERLSLQWQTDWGKGNDYSVVTAYRQNVRTQQNSDERRTVRNRPLQLRREFDYHFDVSGLNAQVAQSFDFLDLQHHSVYGVEWTKTDIDEQRNGEQRDLTSGVISSTVLGENLPVRDFPLSTINERAIYWNDEITLGERWLLLPALRYERYDLNARTDTLWQLDNPGAEPVDIEQQSLTPKLGLVYQWDDDNSVYWQWSKGFRSPPFEDANIGLYIPSLHLRALPNPNLKPEKSTGLEMGWRNISATQQWDVGVFYTRFDEFIETKVNLGVDPESGDTLFQSQNINEARIYGLEMQSLTELPKSSIGRFSLRSALYYGKGENRDNHLDLNSIAPPNGSVGVIWDTNDDDLRAQFCVRFADDKKHIDESKTDLKSVHGYAIFDLSMDWKFHSHWSATAGVFNLGDKTWWQWTDIKSLENDHPAIPLLSQPGRYLSVTIRGQW